jgi:uncharacterized Zn finger protein (UPF0148 family)
MFCQNCGKELPAGANACPACGAVVPGHVPAGHPASFQQSLEETRRAVRDLIDRTAQLTKRVAARAEDAAKEPSATARKAVDRVTKELDDAARDLERLLKEL